MNAYSGITITCGKCGKVADVDEWTRRPISGELPAGTFQCPHCQWAFQRAAAGGHKVFRDGRGRVAMVIPERVELRPVEARI
jgi:hypothetical protein